MRYLVICYNEEIGNKIINELKEKNIEDIVLVTKDVVDFKKNKKVHNVVFYSEPDFIISCINNNSILESAKILNIDTISINKEEEIEEKLSIIKKEPKTYTYKKSLNDFYKS